MNEKRIILFFCMIFVANATFSQFSPKKINNNYFFKEDSLRAYTPLVKHILPGNFYITGLGFICRREWKFESVTKIPFRFRIGSLQYCDWLEGKKTTIIVAPNY